jgi:hypothetical protein
MVAGELFEATRDAVTAMEFIGDRDISMAVHYIRRRLDRARQAAREADAQGRSAIGGRSGLGRHPESGSLMIVSTP